MLSKEIRDLSVDELISQEKDLKQELFNLKFQHSLGQLQSTAKIKDIKKINDIIKLLIY